MKNGLSTILYPITDPARAKSLFTALLGEPPTNDSPYYIGWTFPTLEFGLVPNGQQQGLTGPVPYWSVDDIQATIQSLVGSGGKLQQEPREVGGGRLVAIVNDADGNAVGLMQG